MERMNGRVDRARAGDGESGVVQALIDSMNRLCRAFAVVVLCALCVPAARAAVGPTVSADDSEMRFAMDIASFSKIGERGTLFSIPVSPVRGLTFRLERVLDGADGARTLVGESIDESAAATIYLTIAGAQVYASVTGGGNEFVVEANAEGAAVVRDLAKRGATRALSFATPDFRVPPTLGEPIDAAMQDPDQQKVMPTPQVTIDLMVVYTAAFATRHGAGVAARLNNLVAQANDSYLRSEVAITLRLVHSLQSTYADTGDNGAALDAFTNGTGVFSGIAATRTSVGADLVALIRPYHQPSHNGCGLAWVGGYNQTAPQSQYGYAVIGEGNDVNGSSFYCPDTSFTHELGHNMGLMHDRATVLAQNGGAIAYGATSYAFGYIIPGTSPSVGDIMSYSDRGVTCFSSPNVYRQGPISGGSGGSCNVTPTTGDVLGVSSANASTSADTAAALNFTRTAISNFRAAAAAPTISGTISNGGGIAGVQFCARPSAGVTCNTSNASGAYSCTVPSGWTGTLHSPRVGGNRIPPQVFGTGVTGATTRNVAARTHASLGCDLDIDNNGLFEPAIDGLAIMRRALGLGQTSMTGLSGTCAQTTSAANLYAAANPANFDVTGGGNTRPTTDALVILRAMRGLTGVGVTAGLGLGNESGATRTTWGTGSGDGQIRAWLNTNCGTEF